MSGKYRIVGTHGQPPPNTWVWLRGGRRGLGRGPVEWEVQNSLTCTYMDNVEWCPLSESTDGPPTKVTGPDAWEDAGVNIHFQGGDRKVRVGIGRGKEVPTASQVVLALNLLDLVEALTLHKEKPTASFYMGLLAQAKEISETA